MLIPKIITTFLTLIFGLFCFSIIYFLLENLPKSTIAINFMIEHENLDSINLCSIFQKSDDLKNIIKNIAKNENVEYNKNLLISKMKKLGFENTFEILINDISIKLGSLKLDEVYRCYVLDDDRTIEIIIKL